MLMFIIGLFVGAVIGFWLVALMNANGGEQMTYEKDSLNKDEKTPFDNSEHCVCCGKQIPEGSQYCVICGLKIPQKQRQIDRIRNMNVDELANLMYGACDNICFENCTRDTGSKTSCRFGEELKIENCINCVKQWLLSEVKENEQ